METSEKNTAKTRLKDIIQSIQQMLEETGVYDASLSFSVEKAATDLLIYRRLRDACLDDDTSLTFTEQSREGDDRIKMNPIFAECARQSKVVGDAFDKLMMNAKGRGKKKNSDKLAQLMNDLKVD